MSTARADDDSIQTFPTTHWSLVEAVAQREGEPKRAALAQLIERYLPALRCHLILARHLDRQAVDDILQEFVTEKLLDKDIIARAEQARGRLRSYLLAALNRFVSNRLRFGRASKRSSSRTSGLEESCLPADHHADPRLIFDVAWARRVLAQATTRMRNECRTSGRIDIWGVFEARVLLPAQTGASPTPYAELVKAFGFVAPSQASNALVTGNRMFRRCMRAVVAEYVRDERDVEAEILDLRRILSNSRAGSALSVGI